MSTHVCFFFILWKITLIYNSTLSTHTGRMSVFNESYWLMALCARLKFLSFSFILFSYLNLYTLSTFFNIDNVLLNLFDINIYIIYRNIYNYMMAFWELILCIYVIKCRLISSFLNIKCRLIRLHNIKAKIRLHNINAGRSCTVAANGINKLRQKYYFGPQNLH